MEDDSPVFYMDFLGIFGKGSRAHDHNALMVVKGVSVSKAAGMVRHRHSRSLSLACPRADRLDRSC